MSAATTSNGNCIALDDGEEMCLCPVHFLFPVVQVVSDSDIAAG